MREFLAYIKNKKIIFGFLSILFLIGLTFVYLKNKNGKEIYQNNNQFTTLSAALYQNPEKDTDNDGLRDWEEILWKTDLNKPDTDGDGTSDGDEIAQKRNPLARGPNDGLTDGAGINRNNSVPQNLSDAFNEQLLTIVITNKELGKTISATDAANSLISDLDALAGNSVNNYTEKNIRVSDDASQESIENYGNGLASAIKKYFDPIPESEMVVLSKATVGNDKASFKKLKDIGDAYKNTAAEIFSLETPAALSQNHLNLLNSFEQISRELSDLSKSSDDPALGLIALKQYQTSSQTAYQTLKEISHYFLDNDMALEKTARELLDFYL